MGRNEFVATAKPGEKIAYDMMDIGEQEKYVLWAQTILQE